jgi:divalent metal cation (Fe/Co/Zn/Cd) transporter
MSVPREPFRMPPDKVAALRRAKRLEWITIAFVVSIIVVVGLAMGSSQTMKAMWTEDVLSLVPPIAFLFGARFLDRPAGREFPYGYRRAVMIAFLCGAVALFGLGSYMLGDSVAKLIMAEHPTIQTIAIGGHRVWLGWLMIAALIYSVVPPFVLGRLKTPLAEELHEKALQTDADINKGDWLAGLAGVLGIGGIAFGYWWADSVAAGVISLEIVKDGYGDLRNSVALLMNRRPTDVHGKRDDATPERLEIALEGLDWVTQARVRLREDGDLLSGEAFVVPRDEQDLMGRLAQATDIVHAFDWRIHDVNVVPVTSLD